MVENLYLAHPRLNLLYRAYAKEPCASLHYLLRVIPKDRTLRSALEEANLCGLGVLRVELEGGVLSYSYSLESFTLSIGARGGRTDARRLRTLPKEEVSEGRHSFIKDKNAGKKLQRAVLELLGSLDDTLNAGLDD